MKKRIKSAKEEGKTEEEILTELVDQGIEDTPQVRRMMGRVSIDKGKFVLNYLKENHEIRFNQLTGEYCFDRETMEDRHFNTLCLDISSKLNQLTGQSVGKDLVGTRLMAVDCSITLSDMSLQRSKHFLFCNSSFIQ